MAPASGAGGMEEYMSVCVQRSLALFLYDDARFMAERLVAAAPSEVGRAPAAWNLDSGAACMNSRADSCMPVISNF